MSLFHMGPRVFVSQACSVLSPRRAPPRPHSGWCGFMTGSVE